MKNRFYQHYVLLFVITLSCCFITSCNKAKHSRTEPIVITHEFTNANWTFDEQVINMDFTITDTTKPYRIEFYLTYDTTLNELTEIPVNVTLTAPDGMESFVSSTLNFDRNINKNITPTGNGSIYTMKLVAYPSKKLMQTGKYGVTFYRKTPKYDNYGLHNLTMKVLPVK